MPAIVPELLLIVVGMVIGALLRCIYSRERSASANLAMALGWLARLRPPSTRGAILRLVRQPDFEDLLHNESPTGRMKVIGDSFSGIRDAHEAAGTWALLSRGLLVCGTTALLAVTYDDSIAKVADFVLAGTAAGFAFSAVTPSRLLRIVTFTVATAGILVLGWAPVESTWLVGWQVAGTTAGVGFALMILACIWQQLERLAATIITAGLGLIAGIDIVDAVIFYEAGTLKLTIAYFISSAGVLALAVVFGRVALGRGTVFVPAADADPGPPIA